MADEQNLCLWCNANKQWIHLIKLTIIAENFIIQQRNTQNNSKNVEEVVISGEYYQNLQKYLQMNDKD